MATEGLGYELNDDEFIDLLRKLISESEHLQDNPPDLIPTEDLACKHVMDVLGPLSTESGGPLVLEQISYEEGRSNILISYPGKGDKAVSFVGSHLDVVPANPESWERNPFELIIEGDKLYGRGTTDCLGHVALLTCLFKQLATSKPELNVTINAVFIASEEATAKPGIGVDGLMAAGKLDHLRAGPVFWVDCADSQPCIGTAGAIMWHIKATGYLFHSGLPHKGVNALEFGFEAVKRIQERFYTDFPAHPEEERYNFATPSTMKPTQMSVAKGGLNQIPPHATISGDIRLTPFYKTTDVRAAIQRYVDEINEDPTVLPTHGPVSKYVLPEKDFKASLELTFGELDMVGVACSLESPGFSALCDAFTEVKGEAKPYSICGSLPLVDKLQEAGFDLQLTGFGLSSTYHADNEYCLLSDMQAAMKVLCGVIDRLN